MEFPAVLRVFLINGGADTVEGGFHFKRVMGGSITWGGLTGCVHALGCWAGV